MVLFGGSFVAASTGLSGALSSEPGQAVLLVTAVGGILLGLAGVWLKMREIDLLKFRIETDASIAAAKIVADAKIAASALDQDAKRLAAGRDQDSKRAAVAIGQDAKVAAALVKSNALQAAAHANVVAQVAALQAQIVPPAGPVVIDATVNLAPIPAPPEPPPCL